MFIGAISFVLLFLLDRYSLLRRWKIAPSLDISIALHLKNELLLAVAAHMYVTSRFIYSWPMDSVKASNIVDMNNTYIGSYRTNSNVNNYSNNVYYTYVDKNPSYIPWQLKPTDWMNDSQKLLLPIYVGLSIAVLIITIYALLIHKNLANFKNLFFRHLKIIGKSAKIPFSQVHGIKLYIPILTRGTDKFLLCETNLLPSEYQQEMKHSQQHTDERSLLNLIPDRFKKCVLSTITW